MKGIDLESLSPPLGEDKGSLFRKKVSGAFLLKKWLKNRKK